MVNSQKAENTTKVREILEEMIAQNLPDLTDEEFEKEYNTNAFSGNQRREMTHIELIVFQIVKAAASGEKAAIQTVFDRLMGKAKPAKDNPDEKKESYEDWMDEAIVREEANPMPPPRNFDSDDAIDAEFR